MMAALPLPWPTLVLILSVVSVLTFVVSLAAIPWLVARLPRDYFLARRPAPATDRHPVIRLILTVLRNLIALVLVAGGVLMLFLPGQGLLTLIIGLSLLDFPGRHRLVRWLVSHARIQQGLNWIRARTGQPPLRFADGGRG